MDAEVKASGVSDADADRADVLVYVDQTTTSTANGGEPQVALNRALLPHEEGRRHLARRRHHLVLGLRPGCRPRAQVHPPHRDCLTRRIRDSGPCLP